MPTSHHFMSSPHHQTRANKTDAGNGSKAICRVSNDSRSPSPDPSRSPKKRSLSPTPIIMRLIFTLLLSVLMIGCDTVVSSATNQRCDFRTIESFGGIAVGRPRLDSREHVIVPIRCDVSGTSTITCRPTRLESALACAKPDVRVSGDTIRITVRTCFVGGGLSSQCPDIDLGRLRDGTYLVVYRDPDGHEHPIGAVQTSNLRF
jgi:hypothetical protein